MVEVPIGPGPVAAIVFILFELILLPILMDATTKASSLLIQRQGRKQETIFVKSIPIAPWSDGLLNYRSPMQISLLIIRITCVVIPVYLETTLDSTERPLPVRLQHAFVPRSSFGKKKFDNSSYSFGSELASVFCTYVDKNNWLVARIASSSMRTNSREFENFQCMHSTEKRMFRVSILGEQQDDTWNVTEDFNITGIAPNDIVGEIPDFFGTTKIRNWDAINKDFRVVCLHGTIEVNKLAVTCHHIAELTIHFFVILATVFYKNNEHGQNITTAGNVFYPGEEFRISIPPSALRFKFISSPGISLEFHDEVLFDSRFFKHQIQDGLQDYLKISYVDKNQEKQARNIEFLQVLSQHLLYSYDQNIIVTSSTQNVKNFTIVNKETILVGAVEVVCILIFAIVMTVLFNHKIRTCPPNTFKGLSQAWVRSRPRGN